MFGAEQRRLNWSCALLYKQQIQNGNEVLKLLISEESKLERQRKNQAEAALAAHRALATAVTVPLPLPLVD